MATGPGPGPGPGPGKVATTITGSAPGVDYGQASAITATVAPAGTTGTVTALLNGVAVGSAQLAGGTATITVAGKVLSPGVYAFTLRYQGNDTHQDSSTVVSHTVAKVTPTMTVKAPKKIEVGDKAKVKVKLAAAGGLEVTGRVQVKLKGKTYNGKIEDGKAVITLPKAKDTGKLKLRVIYKGSTLLAAVEQKVKIKVVDS
jgi:hypothetical protein